MTDFLSYHVGLDGINLLFILLTALLTLLVSCVGKSSMKAPPDSTWPAYSPLKPCRWGKFLGTDLLHLGGFGARGDPAAFILLRCLRKPRQAGAARLP